MAGILSLPIEVLAYCVNWLDVGDVLRLRSTSRELYISTEEFRPIWADLHRRISGLELCSTLHGSSLPDLRRCALQSYRLDLRWTTGPIHFPPEFTEFPLHPSIKHVVLIPGTDWIYCIGAQGDIYLDSLAAPFAEAKQPFGSYVLLVALSRFDFFAKIKETDVRLYLVDPVSAALVSLAAQSLDGWIISINHRSDLLTVVLSRGGIPGEICVYVRKITRGDPTTSLNVGTTVQVDRSFLRCVNPPKYIATAVSTDVLIIANPRFGLAAFFLPPFQKCRNVGCEDRAVPVQPTYSEECPDHSSVGSPSISPLVPDPTRPTFSQCIVIASNGSWIISLGSMRILKIFRTEYPVGTATSLGSVRGCSIKNDKYSRPRSLVIHAYSYPALDAKSAATATFTIPYRGWIDGFAFDDSRGRIGILDSHSSKSHFKFVDVL
ncbi:hypothetical protein C8R45DRAFT_1208342 [Mycena sanguinolenta]|nr:hypothetical protein C8R45DRAFT_1208342 [Mycena sanguinolenta]